MKPNIIFKSPSTLQSVQRHSATVFDHHKHKPNITLSFHTLLFGIKQLNQAYPA